MIDKLPNDRAQIIVVLGAVFHTARLIRGDQNPPIDTSTFEKKSSIQDRSDIADDLDRAEAFVVEVEKRFPDKPAKPPKGK